MKWCFHKCALVVPASAALVLISMPTKCSAIPYFARKYKTTCSRCHTAVPKLNTFGKNFQLHGYQQPGDSKVNKVEFPEDKNLVLLDQIPVAFLIENQVQMDKAVGNASADNFASPLVFHLFAADTISPDIGVFAELATQGGVTDVGKVSLTFSHLANQNIFLQAGNLDLYEHGVTEHDLFGRSGFAVQDIGLASPSVGGSPFVPSAQHEGFKIYGLIGASVTPDLIHSKETGGDSSATGLAHGTQAAGCAQGKGELEVVDPMDRQTGILWEVGMFNSTNVNGNATTPNPSDAEARLNVYFGGDSFIGVSAYSGLMTVGDGITNRFRYGGPDFSINFGKPIEKSKGMFIKPFNLFGGYVSGTADNPGADGTKAKWNGFFVEQDVALNDKTMAFVRYDKVNGTNLNYLSPTYTEALTGNVTYYLRTNFWIGLEYTHDLSSAKQNLFGLLFNFAF